MSAWLFVIGVAFFSLIVCPRKALGKIFKALVLTGLLATVLDFIFN